MNTQKNPNNTLTLLGVVACFVLPIIGALYLYLSGYKPMETTNQGELIVPAFNLSDVELSVVHNDTLETSRDLTEKNSWWLIYVLPEKCDTSCQQNIHNLRQAHLALGKDYKRVNRLVLSDNTESVLFLEAPQQKDAKLITAILPLAPTESSFARSYYYVVDPLGNVMMRYTPNTIANDILKDMKKLLKASKIG